MELPKMKSNKKTTAESRTPSGSRGSCPSSLRRSPPKKRRMPVQEHEACHQQGVSALERTKPTGLKSPSAEERVSSVTSGRLPRERGALHDLKRHPHTRKRKRSSTGRPSAVSVAVVLFLIVQYLCDCAMCRCQ